MGPGRSTDLSLIHRLRLKITGSDTIPRQYGTCTSIRFAEGVPRRSFGGLIFSPFHICSCCCCHMLPDRSLRITFKMGCGVGAVIGLAIVLFEWKLRRVSLKRLIGAAIGSILGIFGAYLFALVIRNSVQPGHTQSFLQILVMLLMAYVGLIVGANKGDLLNLSALGGIFGGEKQAKKTYKILDTSVIIDGRISDIA